MLHYTPGDNGSIVGENQQKIAHGANSSPVMAVASAGYHFAGWSDGLSTASRIDKNVQSDLTVTAVFAINQYTLNYTPGENGSIEGPINQTVNHGNSAIPVKAVAAKHYHFVSWSDGVNTAQRTDSDVTTDLAVTATFNIDQYTLTYRAAENGSINGESTQQVDHGGSAAMVTAVPMEGYHFERWSDGLTTAQRTDSGVTGPLEEKASFAINQYTLNYTSGNNGTIDGASSQTIIHGNNANPVTAVPAEHYHFVRWSDGVSTAQRTDRGVTAKLGVTAVFAIDQYTLTYSAENNGTIKGTSSQKINYGGSGSAVTAVPDVGYHFETWSDGLTTASRTDSPVTADLSLTVHFAINQYTVTYTAGENGTIDGTALQVVDHGNDASPVTAVANQGYHFVNWNDGLSSARRNDTDITGDLTASAAFEVNTYTVGGHVSGLVEGTQVILQNNADDNLELSAEGEFVFTVELLNAETYEVTVLSQPTSPNQTCTVTDGSGTIAFENIADIEVTCILNKYTIGGTLTGVPKEDQVVLQNNENDDLVLTASGIFTFNTPLDDGSQYKVTIKSQPARPHWKCTVENAVNSLTGSDVTDIIVDCYPEVFLEAVAGIHKVKLNWNSDDFLEIHANKVVFNLCRTEEALQPDRFRDCRNLAGGVVMKKLPPPPLNVLELENDTIYWFQLQVLADAGKRRPTSEVLTATPYGGLNDSGIDWCANDTSNIDFDSTRTVKTKSCAALEATHPGQDAIYGRDAAARTRTLLKTGQGTTGFDFTKFCRNGDRAGEGECAPNPKPGPDSNNLACNHDNVTGLTWEIKADSGLQNKDNTYTWYQENGKVNGGEAGLQHGGKCEGSACDTQSYIEAINKMGLCGANDWRLPTKRELLSIVDNSRFKPAIDERLFPMALPTNYWSSSPYPDISTLAWQVYFLYGEASPSKKSEMNHIRLVRGRTVTFGMNNP